MKAYNHIKHSEYKNLTMVFGFVPDKYKSEAINDNNKWDAFIQRLDRAHARFLDLLSNSEKS